MMKGRPRLYCFVVGFHGALVTFLYPLEYTEKYKERYVGSHWKYKEVARGSSVVIKHSPHYPRVEGFTPAASTGIENNDEREAKVILFCCWLQSSLRCIFISIGSHRKIQSEIHLVPLKRAKRWSAEGSRVFKHLPHYPRFKGLTSATSTGIENNDEREAKIIMVWCWLQRSLRCIFVSIGSHWKVQRGGQGQ